MEKVLLEPYLFYTGTCRQAMEFYKEIFGGELNMQTVGESPEQPEGTKDENIMHAILRTPYFTIMASDGTRTEPYDVSNISLSLGGTDEATLTGYFEKLSEGGKVTQPLAKMFWGDTFGSVTDKFGIDWMVNITAEKSE